MNEVRMTIHEGVGGRGFIRGWSTINNKSGSQPFRLGSAYSIAKALSTIIEYLSENKPVYIKVENHDDLGEV